MSHDVNNKYVEQLDEVRHQFFEVFKDNIQKNVYDKRDLERLRLEDDYVCSFLRHQTGSVDKANEMVDVSLRWRKELEVNDLTEQSFPRALHEAGIIYYHNCDKNGHQILHIAMAKYKKDQFKLLAVQQLLAWYIDKEFLKHPTQRIVVLLDMTDTGLSNVDIDLIKFQVRCFTTYYPALLAYMLVFEMPWVLNAIWNIIKKLLNAEQQRSVLLVKKPQMPQYIERDQLFVHMGGSDNYKYSFIPSEDSGIEVTSHESDCESLVSSYEQMGNPTTTLRKRVTFGGLTKSISFDGCDGDDRAQNLVNLTNSTDNSVYHGSLANISPSERLTLSIESGKGDAVSHITISNTSQFKLSFKVRTTSPDVYRVKPHTGILAVKDRVMITIVLPNGHLTSDTKDKFLVMLLTLKDDISENNPECLNALWKKVSKDSEDYMEHRLMCDKVHNEKTISTKVDHHENVSPTSPVSLVEKMETILTKQQETTEQLKKIILLLQILFVFLLVLVFLMILKCF